MHSLTKFVSGASDVIAGAICGPGEFIQGMMDLMHGPVRGGCMVAAPATHHLTPGVKDLADASLLGVQMMLLGPTMDPEVASMLTLRMPHLGLRQAGTMS